MTQGRKPHSNDLKGGVDKKHYSFSTRDVYYDYRRKYKKRGDERVDRKTFNLVVDAIIDKLGDAIIYDHQIYKPRGGIGNFQIYKFKPIYTMGGKTSMHLRKTDGYWFYLKWDKNRRRFNNRRIYTISTPAKFRKKLREHVLSLADDPYKKDYIAPLNTPY